MKLKLVNGASEKYFLCLERDSLQYDLERSRQKLRIKIKALDISKKRSEKRLAANVENVKENQKIKVVLKRLAEDALKAAEIGIGSIEDAKQLRDRVVQLEQQLLQGVQAADINRRDLAAARNAQQNAEDGLKKQKTDSELVCGYSLETRERLELRQSVSLWFHFGFQGSSN